MSPLSPVGFGRVLGRGLPALLACVTLLVTITIAYAQAPSGSCKPGGACQLLGKAAPQPSDAPAASTAPATSGSVMSSTGAASPSPGVSTRAPSAGGELSGDAALVQHILQSRTDAFQSIQGAAQGTDSAGNQIWAANVPLFADLSLVCSVVVDRNHVTAYRCANYPPSRYADHTGVTDADGTRMFNTILAALQAGGQDLSWHSSEDEETLYAYGAASPGQVLVRLQVVRVGMAGGPSDDAQVAVYLYAVPQASGE